MRATRGGRCASCFTGNSSGNCWCRRHGSWPGIGLVAASDGSTGTPRGPATTSIASSAQSAGEGAQVQRDTGRNSAYESIPIDVKGNGTYFLTLARSRPLRLPLQPEWHSVGLAFRRGFTMWGPLDRIMLPRCKGTSRWVSPCPTFRALTRL